MVNVGLLAAEIFSLVWGTQLISTGFTSWQRYCTATLRRWTDGATCIWHGGHHVGHWPTFLVVFFSFFITLSFCLAPCGRLSWLFISFWAHENVVYSIAYCASCRKKRGLATTDMCPCGKRQAMSHIVNSCPQSKLEGAAATACSWWRCYGMTEETRLVNALDNNNNMASNLWRKAAGATHSLKRRWIQKGQDPLGDVPRLGSLLWIPFSASTLLTGDRKEYTICGWLIKVLHCTWHKMGHFGDILLSQSLGIVLKKLNLT